jgi:ATP-binding cassette subfamily B (MDR/TAP) protein 1
MSHVSYASVVGILMYAMVCTRLDIIHAMGVLRRYISKLGKENWTTVKRVFKDLHDTSSYGLCYQGRPGLNILLEIHG